MAETTPADDKAAPAAKTKASGAKKPTATETELRAIQGGGRNKIILLAALLVLALVAAAWMFWSGGGSGNAENPGKVLVVSSDPGHKAYLMELGFEADVQTFDHIEGRAHDEIPGLDERGVLAIMTLADRFGYGYVAFHRPYNLDFSELETAEGAPSFGDRDLFAVVSAGDLADPHHVTANSDLLQALFEQERLAELVPPKQPSTMKGVELRDQLRLAIERLTEPPRLPRLRY